MIYDEWTAAPGTRRLSFNGQAIDTAAPTLQDLLLERGYDLRSAIACALNTRFVPRTAWPQRSLGPGDRIDVVAPITGG